MEGAGGGGSLGHEGGALLSGISVLLREDPQSSLAPSTLGGHVEKSGTQERVLSPPRWHPDLGLPDPRTVRKKCLLFISHPVGDILVQHARHTQTRGYSSTQSREDPHTVGDAGLCQLWKTKFKSRKARRDIFWTSVLVSTSYLLH